MKTLKLSALLLATVALAACGDADEAEMQQQMAQAAQIGQAQAIAEIIERANAEPCQPINLFNNLDENNKKEVNLINIACENLDLPEIPAAEEAKTEGTEEAAAEATTE